MKKIRKSTLVTSYSGIEEKFNKQMGEVIEEYQSLELEVDIKYSITQLNGRVVFSVIILGYIEV